MSLLAVLGLLAGSAAAAPDNRWSDHIAAASARFGVPRQWIRRVIAAESGGRTMASGQPIRSASGAMGLMQLMPRTWQEMRAAYGLGENPDDPRDNILAGTAYLRRMYNRFGYPGLFAAYNAGPARYRDHLATGRRLPAETIAYVAAVTRTKRPATPATGTPARGLFLARSKRRVSRSRPLTVATGILFVGLSTHPASAH
jgi:soluble lytic murein transglycosylase-like protein